MWVRGRGGSRRAVKVDSHRHRHHGKSTIPGADAVVTARYGARWPGGAGNPFVWTFRVKGHKEFERDVDVGSCAP